MTDCTTCHAFPAKLGSERAELVAATRRALRTERPSDIAAIAKRKAQVERTKAMQAAHLAECTAP